jgi:hypothetical protein
MTKNNLIKAPPAYNQAVEERFREEVALFKLNYTCDDCMNFDQVGQQCVELYPIDALRTPNHPVRLKEKDWLFCKCFEMN